MFSPNVHENVRQPLAMQNFESIRDICISLNNRALFVGFFQQELVNVQNKANQFVESFAYDYGMSSRTIQPLVWSFAIEGYKLFDDGVIELIDIDSNHPRFGYMEVNNSKITQSNTDNMRTAKLDAQDNIRAHEAWLNKLASQISGWQNEILSLPESKTKVLTIKLNSLETILQTIKSDSKKITRVVILEIEHQWNTFQDEINKLKDSIHKKKS